MGLHLFPWFDRDKEAMRDKRTEEVVAHGKEVEKSIRDLAESYRAVGLILRKATKASTPPR